MIFVFLILKWVKYVRVAKLLNVDVNPIPQGSRRAVLGRSTRPVQLDTVFIVLPKIPLFKRFPDNIVDSPERQDPNLPASRLIPHQRVHAEPIKLRFSLPQKPVTLRPRHHRKRRLTMLPFQKAQLRNHLLLAVAPYPTDLRKY
jgi:hypothetical protein